MEIVVALTVIVSIASLLFVGSVTYMNSRPADGLSIQLLDGWVDQYTDVKAEIGKRFAKGYLTEGDFWAAHETVQRIRSAEWAVKRNRALQDLKSKTYQKDLS